MRDEGNKEEEIRTVTFFSPLLERENETRAFRETHLTRARENQNDDRRTEDSKRIIIEKMCSPYGTDRRVVPPRRT